MFSFHFHFAPFAALRIVLQAKPQTLNLERKHGPSGNNKIENINL